MLAHEIAVRDVNARHIGWATTESIRTTGGERLVGKGGLLSQQVVDRMDEVADRVLHLIEFEPGDLHENEAGARVASAVVGPGIEIDGPYNSRYNLRSRHRGLLVVDAERVQSLNAVGDLSLFTRYTDQAVNAGHTVAGVKATPIVVEQTRVEAVEDIASASDGPILDVLPFTGRSAAVVATESLHPRLRQSFEERVHAKLGWFGGEVLSFSYIDPESDVVAAAMSQALQEGAQLVLAAGGNTLDPLDPILRSLPLLGAEMLHFGAPADPGSMFWVAEASGVPIFNLASCSMYSEATVIDLMLPLVFAGRGVTGADVANLGYGGLLEDGMKFRFPPYD